MDNSDFNPSPILGNRHLQSVLAGRPPRRQVVRRHWRLLAAASEDLIVDCGDGVQLLGHYSAPTSPPNGSLTVLIHGWEGSADSTYICSATLALTAAGFGVFRLNLRDHGRSHHLNEGLFHSCRLAEVIGAVKWVADHYQPARLSLAGFSLGGNFALRVAAVAPGLGIDLDRVVAVCPVLDPAQTMRVLDSGWVLYRQFFIRKWRASLIKKMQCFPKLYSFRGLNRFNSIEAMTDHFVHHYTEYADLPTYLRGYTLTGGRLNELTVPSAILLAEDDPVIPVNDIDELNASPALEIYRSVRGGHCGFITDFRCESWLDKFIVRHMQAATDEQD